jgi:peptidoglycan/xylan/chitin deacetylase (PgdA/CDA1 family)
MKFLRDRHYNDIPLEELAALFREKKKIPPRTVILTFDDGYKDFYTFAYPVLKEYRLPAVMFIITEEAGRAQNDRLSWDEIKEMQRSGLITFGSHCIGPEPLINIKSEQEVKRQIFDSKRILEEKLGVKVNTFSYPEGMFTPKIRQTVIDAGYACAVATQPGIDYPDNDVFAMKRIRISEKSRNLFIFAYKLSGYYTHIREYQKERKRKRNAERQAYPDF